MPIELSKSEQLSIPERLMPAVQADLSWLRLIVLQVPKNAPWQAMTEGNPMDSQGNVYYRHPKTGVDTTIRIESFDLKADAAKSQVLADAINQVMAGIIVAATELKKLRDAERLAEILN